MLMILCYWLSLQKNCRRCETGWDSTQKSGSSALMQAKDNGCGVTSGSERRRINGEEMEEVKAFKYLGVWFDRST